VQYCKLQSNHPDIPCLPRGYNNTNCIGKEFGLEDGDGTWYNPIRKYHGTHVAGTIGASGLNQHGIVGIVPDGNFCFLIGRVFGESGAGSHMSAVFEAVEWMLDHGVHVINMSLGSALYNAAGDELMATAYANNVLLVAAAGNEGTDEIQYPANYQGVLSVAAVDETRQHASFSQYNAGVDVTGPGVDILSTVPLTLGGAVLVSSAAVGTVGSLLAHSTEPSTSSPIAGTLTACSNYASNICEGDGGHVCLIERYVYICFGFSLLNTTCIT
jgi:serine protease